LVGWCLMALLIQIGYMMPWSFETHHLGQADNINNIRNTLVNQEITSLTS